jgi:hypothetical protein
MIYAAHCLGNYPVGDLAVLTPCRKHDQAGGSDIGGVVLHQGGWSAGAADGWYVHSMAILQANYYTLQTQDKRLADLVPF